MTNTPTREKRPQKLRCYLAQDLVDDGKPCLAFFAYSWKDARQSAWSHFSQDSHRADWREFMTAIPKCFSLKRQKHLQPPEGATPGEVDGQRGVDNGLYRDLEER